MPQSLTIKNIGPIKSLDIKLSRVNIFIGKQSSGKSTIAKIISFCKWLEKQWIFYPDPLHYDNTFVKDKFIKYHNFESYIYPDSYFYYETDALKIKFENEALEISANNDPEAFSLIKNAYIPSERNLVSLPGFQSFKMNENYIRDFIEDWLLIRNQYSKNATEILNLDCKYIYNKNNNTDEILLNENRSISLTQASSGLQSVTPLFIIMDYLTNWIYSNKEDRSAEVSLKIQESSQKFLQEALIKDNINEDLEETISKMQPGDIQMFNKFIENGYSEEDINKYPLAGKMIKVLGYVKKTLDRFYLYNHSNLVVEEPEQNLFPQTQVELIYYMLSKINHARDFLVITTHSPYILYAINNAMLSHQVKGNENIEMMEIDVPQSAFLDPEDVSIWEIRDGKVSESTKIQDHNGLVKGNYFDDVMQCIMADFNNLLSIKISDEIETH